MKNIIQFYHKNQPYYFLTNFYPSAFTHNHKLYPTNEHYFQSKKFQGTQMEETVRQAKGPRDAFLLGKTSHQLKRADWEQVKESIMYQGLILKFTQNKDLAQQLLETKDSILVEHTENDHYWADGGDGTGKNRLGVLIMKLRSQLKEGKI